METGITDVARSPLPPAILTSGLLEHLSFDAQLYIACIACGREMRIDVMSFDSLDEIADSTCASCNKKEGWAYATHTYTTPIHCTDCGQDTSLPLVPWEKTACPSCRSQNIEMQDGTIDPPFPSQFTIYPSVTVKMMGPKLDIKQPWGISGARDAMMLNYESSNLGMLPESHRYIYPLILFCDRLKQYSDYSTAEDFFYILNIQANLSQQYFKQTGSWMFGVEALNAFEQMTAFVPDELNKAIAQHSYAMAVYSLFAKYNSEEYLNAITGRPGVRQDAIAKAEEAEQILVAHEADGVEGLGQHTDRVRYIIGDLLRMGNTDDAQRTLAIGYFNAALEDPEAAEMLSFAIKDSRAQTILALEHPTEDQLNMAVDDLKAAAKATGSDAAYKNQWRAQYRLGKLMIKSGRLRESLPVFEVAAASSLQQFQALNDERLMLAQAEQFANVFESLALVYANVGWADEALTAVEITRAASLRMYTSAGPEREAWAKELQDRYREDLWPAALKDHGSPLINKLSKRHISDYLEENLPGPYIVPLLQHHHSNTAMLTLFITEGIATAFISSLTDDGKWALNYQQWRPDEQQLDILQGQRYVQPGPFRERLMKQACELGYTLFIKPVLDVLVTPGFNRLIVSVPGILNRLPFEAFKSEADNSTFPDNSICITYMPSIRMGSDIVHRVSSVPGNFKNAKVLIIGYAGEDLPGKERELEGLLNTWGSQATYLPGDTCTKISVLQELAKPYDIIHFLCHGTFNEAYPLSSALHFCADRNKDNLRVTAEDLLSDTRLSTNPLIILSACSSGVTADSRTNSFEGLAGSFFRIGARAIVGSRWAVHDATAAAMMLEFHNQLKSSEDTPSRCLQNSRLKMYIAKPQIEDWAAFGYFGID